MADIDVTLHNDADTLARDAEAAARGMAKIAAQEERIKKIHAADLAKGVARDPKKIAQALRLGDSLAAADQARAAKGVADALRVRRAEEARAAKGVADALRVRRAEEARQRGLLAGQKRAITGSKQFAEQIGKLRNGNVIGLGASFGTAGLAAGVAVGAIAAITLASVAAVAGVAALAAKITLLGLEAKKSKDESEGLLALYSGGDLSTVAKLEKVFDSLGITLEDGTKKFETLRRAGLSVGEAVASIKATSDIRAVTHSVAVSDRAFEEMAKRAGALKDTLDKTKDPKLRAEAIAQYRKEVAALAAKVGAVGDGSNAAAAKASTLEGALFRLTAIKTTALERIGERVKPSLDRLATQVTNTFERFAASKQGQDAINRFGEAVSHVLDGVGTAISFVTTHWDTISKAIKVFALGVGIALSPVIIAVALIGAAVVALGVAWAASTAAIGFVTTKVVGGVVSALGYIDTKIREVINYLVGAVPKWIEAGTNFVGGLIEGVTGAAGRLYEAITGMAKRAYEKFTSFFSMQSPSRLMMAAGVNISAGVEKGVEQSTPGVVASTERLAQATAEPMINAPSLGSDVAPGLGRTGAESVAPGASAGGPTVVFQIADGAIRIEGAGDLDEETLVRSMRRELEAMATNLLLQTGARRA